MKIRLLVADDSALLQTTVGYWLSQHEDIDVVASARDGRTTVELACDLGPDVVLMAARMRRLNGIDATREITGRAPGVKVLILADELDCTSVRQALEAGASGYLSRRCDPEELVTAIHCVVEAGMYLSPGASASVVHDYIGGAGGTAPPSCRLTVRERQVLQLFAEGLHTKGIASELSLSPKTVDWHKGRLMRKLDIDSVAGLVRYAIAEGLSPLAMPSACGTS
jgi:DNA-binding NarL/FixJ family response regulator